MVRVFVVPANGVGSGAGSGHAGTTATVVDVFVDFFLGIKAGLGPSSEHTVGVIDHSHHAMGFDWFLDYVGGLVGAGG